MMTQTRIHGFTAWINARLLDFNCQVHNVFHDLFVGSNMKLLLESFTGRSMKRFQNLEGLTLEQIVTRVEWFVTELKKNDIIRQSDIIYCRSIGLRKQDHVLDLLWKLVSYDILFTWERSSQLLQKEDKAVCSVPFKWIPEAQPPEKSQQAPKSVSSLLANLDALSSKLPNQIRINDQKSEPKDKTTFHPYPGRELAKSFNKSLPKEGWNYYPSQEKCILDMVNKLLKVATRDSSTKIKKLEDLVHCHAICNVVNYFLPHTFTVEVLLNDRWAVNLALKTLEELLFVRISFSCEDLIQCDLQAVCAYMCFVCMAGFKYKQSRSVVNYLKQLSRQIEEATSRLNIFSSEHLELNQFAEKNDLQQKVIEMKNELQQLKKSYDVERCEKWVKHARKVQRKTKDIIQQKIKDHFDIVVVPRSTNIADLCLTMGINLQLTQGSGFYQVCHKETLTPDCRVVIKKDTGEFTDNFPEQHPRIKSDAHQQLHAIPSQIYEVNPNIQRDFKLFLESKSKKRILKTKSLFLYQVFPGNTLPWVLTLHQAVKANNHCALENLLHFFKATCPNLINQLEPSSGMGPLHLSSQTGHFDLTLLLLESGASVNKKNEKGHTPLDCAMLGQHRDLCQLLIECGSRLPAKNVKAHIVPDVILNQDLRDYCNVYSEMWHTIVPQVIHGNIQPVKQIVEEHKSGRQVMATLRSRCIGGSTLLHIAAYHGELDIVKTLLTLKIDVDILDYRGATPLQRCRDEKTMQQLIYYGADVNWSDDDGNTALHMACYGEPGKPSRMDCVMLLISKGASKKKHNKKGLMPVHCAAMQGRIDIIKSMTVPCTTEWNTIYDRMKEKNTPSLPYLAAVYDHLDCAEWLISHEITFKEGEQAELLFYTICNEVQREKSVQKLSFLLRNGLNVNTCDNKGNSALHLAALHIECHEILKLLLISGAEVNAQNNVCMTPLFNTVFTSNFHGAKLLIDYGADIQHLNNQGVAAFAYINNFDDWISCGIFNDETNELLKAYELQQSVQLVKHVANQIRRNEFIQHYSRTNNI